MARTADPELRPRGRLLEQPSRCRHELLLVIAVEVAHVLVSLAARSVAIARLTRLRTTAAEHSSCWAISS
jgi:hypothetical protein